MKLYTKLLLTSFVTIFFIQNNVVAYNQNFVNHIANEMLRGYDLVGSNAKGDKPIIEQGFMKNLGKLKDFFKPYESTFVQDSKPIMLKKVWDELTPQYVSQRPAVDATTIAELEIIRGGTRPESNLIQYLVTYGDGNNERTECLSTIIGEKRFAEMLSMPLVNHDVCIARQESIRTLMDNDVLHKRSYELLQKMKGAEPYVIDFFSKKEISQYEQDGVYPAALMRIMGLDEIPAMVTATNRLFYYLISPLPGPTVSFGVGFSIHLHRVYSLWRQFLPNQTWAELGLGAILGALRDAAGVGLQVITSTQMQLQMAVLSPFLLAQLGIMKSIVDAIRNMQERVIGVAAYMRAADELIEILNADIQFRNNMPIVSEVYEDLQGNGLSDKHTYLHNALCTKSAFNEGDPSVFSSPGDILVAYKYLSDETIRKQYDDLFNVIGEVDTYVALAQKIKLHEGHENAPFCFVDYVYDAEKPMIRAHSFWNPFIPVHAAVPNDIELNMGNERSIIITGPNTGGKSTNMKGLDIGILLAQTFGIAPARTLYITPFNRLATYLNVTDDTGAGLSLFKAEVKRAKELMDSIKALPKGQFAFVMIDEIFTGTSPDKAAALSHDFVKKICSMENVILISATHFKKLTLLEDETGGMIKNYQVGAIADENGKVLRYTYKIIPGISQISSAQQVVENEGIEF